MNRAKRVRVVVGEAAPAGAGILRSILEADGFEVVGQASSADQLQPVLAAADPQVIVFDADTTATTVLSARDWAPRAGIVVVWPSSVLSPGADQQVEPSRAGADLGEAVRRAVRIHRPQPVVPALVSDVMVFEKIPEAEEPAVAGGISSIASRLRPRRSELSLALAAASIMFLVVAALALQPNKQPSVLAQQPGPTPTPSGPSTPGAGGQTGQSRSAGPGIAGVLAPLFLPAGATGSTPGVGPGPTQPGQPPPTSSPVTGRPSGGGNPGTGPGRPSGAGCNNGHHGHHGLGQHGHHGISCQHADQVDQASRHGHHSPSGGQGSSGGEGDDRHGQSHQGSNGNPGPGHGDGGNGRTKTHGNRGHAGHSHGRGHGRGRGHQSSA